MSHEDSILRLEEIKDQIIAAFNRHTEIEEARKNVWCGDAKEMYYNIILLAEMLSRLSDPEMARPWMSTASGHFGRVCSELRALEETQLEEELTQAFHTCHDALSARIPKIPAADRDPQRVVQNSPENYEFPCSVCGRTAVSVRMATSKDKLLNGVICDGISRGVGLQTQDKNRIFAWLAQGDLAALHDYMENELDIEGGLDAYCPSCDQIYCGTHYNMTRFWDEGFYDCSRGTCPQGHARKIDD